MKRGKSKTRGAEHSDPYALYGFEPLTSQSLDGTLAEEEEGIDDPEDAEDEDDEDEAPRVLVATLEALNEEVPSEILQAYGERPIWFLLAECNDLVGVFERYPESGMRTKDSTAILALLRETALRHNEILQEVIGVTTGIQYGFHANASYDEVVESFEDDGFEVLEGWFSDEAS